MNLTDKTGFGDAGTLRISAPIMNISLQAMWNKWSEHITGGLTFALQIK